MSEGIARRREDRPEVLLSGISNPKALNALSKKTWYSAPPDDKSVRCVVLQGGDRAFSPAARVQSLEEAHRPGGLRGHVPGGGGEEYPGDHRDL